MKNFTLLVAFIAISVASFAQSQRLTLLEEFTQASCGPCAAQNPALNTLLAANAASPRKVISIKYQTSWPGSDPMNAHNPTEVATRVSYYGVTGVPNIEYDGNVLSNAAPSGLTQTGINTEYAATSPFDITLTHTLNANATAIDVTMTITCTQATTGTLVAHIGVVEEEINFLSAPGTNGEKDFYSVMKKMLPNANGTTLPTTWTVGQTQTITQSWTLANVYNLNEVGVVAWVQDNANKNVKQAAYSVPQLIPNAVDAQVAIAAGSAYMCTTAYTPSVQLTNLGGAALTSCDVQYKYDNGATQTQAWTGNLATGATATVTLPTNTLAAGAHTLQIIAANTNAIDVSSVNNQKSISFFIGSAATAAPATADFVTTTFPPANWYNSDADGDGFKWARVATGLNGAGSAKLDCYSIAAGSTDDLYLPMTDFSAATVKQLTFDVAHRIYSASYNDELNVLVSTDCGATWTNEYSKAGSDLATVATASTSAFTPTTAQWRKETVDLTAYGSATELLVKFRGVSDYGNNIYVDNVNLGGAVVGVLVPEAAATAIVLTPNPANEVLSVSFNMENAGQVAVQVVNTLGQVVSRQQSSMASGVQALTINTSDLAAGSYFLNIVSNGKVSSQRFVVAH